MMKLGKLESVDLRQIWAKEHEDFTPWLAENLHFLGDAIGSELELEAQEASVGNFRADILARDVQTNGWVLIENQLERTDHGHLGQLITYASGLKAATVVWLAYQFADEHVAALDWLNSITDDSVQFFGIQIELWRINDSVAPKLNVVAQPNKWENAMRKKYHRVSDDAIAHFASLNPTMKRNDIAKHFGVSERKVYAAIASSK